MRSTGDDLAIVTDDQLHLAWGSVKVAEAKANFGRAVTYQLGERVV